METAVSKEEVSFSCAQRPVFLLIGDSLTQNCFSPQGWGAQLYNWLCRKADVINRGFSGYNSSWVLDGVTAILPSIENVKVVTIFLGANDSVLRASGIPQYVPVEKYEDNLKQLVSAIFAKYGRFINVIVITPPPIVSQMRLEFQVEKYGEKATGILDRSNENTVQYVHACHRAAKEFQRLSSDNCSLDKNDSLANKSQVFVLDMFDHFWQHCSDAKFTPVVHYLQEEDMKALNIKETCLVPYFVDGLHFSPAGDALMFQCLKEFLQTHLPKYSYEGLPNHLPWHDELKANPQLLQDFVYRC